jgi:hypothetical protein
MRSLRRGAVGSEHRLQIALRLSGIPQNGAHLAQQRQRDRVGGHEWVSGGRCAQIEPADFTNSGVHQAEGAIVLHRSDMCRRVSQRGMLPRLLGQPSRAASCRTIKTGGFARRRPI